MAMVSLRGSINEINNEKVYATKQAVTATDAAVDLSAVTNPLSATGETVCRASGISQPLLVLQGTQDFWYCFNTASGTAVTAASGSNPGTFVRAGDQEYVRPATQPGRVYLHLLRSTADGTVVISVAKFASAI